MVIGLRIFIVLAIIAVGWYLCGGAWSRGECGSKRYGFRLWRDQFGIPRILGKDKLSVFYGIGYAQGADRLWTLNLKKRMAQGRMAEIFGDAVLELDLESRNFDFQRVAVMNAKLLDCQTRSYLQAYADGVNDYRRSLTFLPIQFYIFWTDWEEWTVQDSLAQLAFLSFWLEFDWMYELARQRLLETVGFDLAWKLFPFGEQNHFREVTIINNDELKQQNRYKEYKSQDIPDILQKHWVNKTMPIDSIFMPSTDYEALGSNAWVIGGEHTSNGKPLLASDPHLPLFVPSLFYMLEVMVAGEGNELEHQAFGIMADGLPGVMVGVNRELAWGSTASYVDNKDVFHEKVRENKGVLEYEFNKEWKPLKSRKQVFKVRGGDDYVKQFYQTHRGPVLQHLLYKAHFKYGYPIPNTYRLNHTISMEAAIYQPDNSTFKGLLNIMFTKTIKQFENSSKDVELLNVDCVFMDRNDNFGYFGVGRIPKRQIPEMGSFVKDGSSDLYDMGEFYSWEEKPKLFNPSKGYASMANNKFAEDSFDLRGSIHEQTTGRAYRLQKRIQEKIEKGEKFTFDDFAAMQLDTKDQFLSEAFPYVLQGLLTVRQLWSTLETEKLFAKLLTWDYNMHQDSVQASIYHVWEHEFQESLLHGTILSEQERQSIINHAFVEIYLMNLMVKIGQNNLGEEEGTLCRNTQNNGTNIHPCLGNAALIFGKLPKLLKELFGTDKMQEWQWHKIHQSKFVSIPFSEIPGLRYLYERTTKGQGNGRTLNVGMVTHQTKSYNSVIGSVFRMITDIDKTLFNFDTGQSDSIFSPFYDNFVGKKQYQEYIRRNPLQQKIQGWHLVKQNDF